MVGQEISYYGSDHAIHKLVRAHVLLPFFSFWDPFWTQLFHKTFQWFLTQQNFKRWSQWLRSSPTLFIIFSVCELGSIKPWGWIWDPGIWAVPGSMTSNPGIAGFDASELQSVRSFINICDQLFPSFWVLQVVLLFVCQLWSIQTDLLLWSNCCFLVMWLSTLKPDTFFQTLTLIACTWKRRLRGVTVSSRPKWFH